MMISFPSGGEVSSVQWCIYDVWCQSCLASCDLSVARHQKVSMSQLLEKPAMCPVSDVVPSANHLKVSPALSLK